MWISTSPKKLKIAETKMLKLLREAEYPARHITEANHLIVDMANAGLDTNELMERVHFLTEGYKEKDSRSAAERFRACIS